MRDSITLTAAYPCCDDRYTTITFETDAGEGRRICKECGTLYRLRVCRWSDEWLASWSEITESFGPESLVLAK